AGGARDQGQSDQKNGCASHRTPPLAGTPNGCLCERGCRAAPTALSCRPNSATLGARGLSRCQPAAVGLWSTAETPRRPGTAPMPLPSAYTVYSRPWATIAIVRPSGDQ